MKTIILIILSVVLLAGCTNCDTKSQIKAESSNCTSGLSRWLQTCVNELARNRKSESRWFNNIGANDVIFMPKTNPAEEIFLKCESVEPLSADKASIYKKCLEDYICEIQSITAGTTTRGKVNQLLLQNGGISTPKAAIYSHIERPVLKVRIEFEPNSDEHARYPFNENDKVKAVSMPYLGLFIAD
jgi:hypothetical protein